MTAQSTLEALYMFTSSQYEHLKKDYNKLKKYDKARMPFTLFVISVFSTLIEDTKTTPNDKDVQKEKVD